VSQIITRSLGDMHSNMSSPFQEHSVCIFWIDCRYIWTCLYTVNVIKWYFLARIFIYLDDKRQHVLFSKWIDISKDKWRDNSINSINRLGLVIRLGIVVVRQNLSKDKLKLQTKDKRRNGLKMEIRLINHNTTLTQHVIQNIPNTLKHIYSVEIVCNAMSFYTNIFYKSDKIVSKETVQLNKQTDNI
jgi:hypothetical protein